MVTMNIKINPFPVPAGVTLQQPPGQREDGFRPAKEIPLDSLSRETVEQLCDEFKVSALQRWDKAHASPQQIRDSRPHWHDVPPVRS